MTDFVQEANSRYGWVIKELYRHNHPYRAQLPGELATKMAKMSTGTFAFYRGTAHIFYQDMKMLPISSHKQTKVCLQGDSHLQNLNAFQDTSGVTTFDLSDFDEGYQGFYFWDIGRMATSILLAAEENEIELTDRKELVKFFVDNYLAKLQNFKGSPEELKYRLTSSNTSGVVKDTILKASAQTRTGFLNKHTILKDGRRMFSTTGQLQTVTDTTANHIRASMTHYINSIPSDKRYSNNYYTVKDIRLRLGSGIGSLGRYRYWLLLEGPTNSTGDDVILEMKQQMTSSVAIAAPNCFSAASYDYHEGQRTAHVMKAMLTNTDVLVGHNTMLNDFYFFREKSPYQADFDYTKLTTESLFGEALEYYGKALAMAHLRSSYKYSVEKEVTNLNQASFQLQVLNFALNYAAQVRYDYDSFILAYTRQVPLY